jgi:hypothetical protein
MRRCRTLAGAVCVALAAAACTDAADDARGGEPPSITAEVVQLRTDEALHRVQVQVENTGAREVVVEAVTLRVPGFRSAGPVPKDSPLPAGRVVNLPVPYGEVRCRDDGTARVGRPVAVLRVRIGDDPRARRLVVPAREAGGLLARIARGECTARRLAREVDVRFGPRWRHERVDGAVVAHGTLETRLRTGAPRDVTQVAGTVIYALRAGPRPAADGVLASLTARDPHASVPVTVSVSRCDGHARGETKKPYEFLVWLAPPGGEELAVVPLVSAADRAAFQRVCPL